MLRSIRAAALGLALCINAPALWALPTHQHAILKQRSEHLLGDVSHLFPDVAQSGESSSD